jgi:uncharacterized membrane protein YGL010W
MKSSIHDLFEEYADSHRNPLNKVIHWVCVPAIFFSIILLLLQVRLHEYVSLASVSIVAVVLYFLRLSPPFAAGMVFLYILCMVGAKIMALQGIILWQAGLYIFATAWIGQFIGHKIEGKKPSFLTDIKFLLIGPAWLMGFIFKRIGIRY